MDHGRRAEPKRIGDLVSVYLERLGLAEVSRAQRLRAAWRRAVPEAVFRETRLQTLRDGVLRVGVSSSALLFELEGFRKPEILARFRAAEDEYYVRNIRFRLEPRSSARARTRME